MIEPVRLNVLVVAAKADAETTRLVNEVLAEKDVRGLIVGNMDSAAAKIETRQWDLLMGDLAADGDVIGLLRKVRQALPELPVILFGDDDSARRIENVLNEERTELLAKPVRRESLESTLEVLLPAHKVHLAASAEDEDACRRYQIAGKSEKFLQTIRLAEKVAPTSVPVLITGESGTGKELISYLIHHRSNRSGGPFIHVNCAAMSETLLESELFGHEKGAFTGAHERRKGRFERAHGGTLLLDELSETGQRLQAELLRVLEQQNFERLGGSDTVRVNVRVISTSNRDLTEEARKGRFRQDLFYRISGVHIHVPPLRERKEDIPTLVWHFVNLHAREVRRQIMRLDERMMEFFHQYHWPGNVRQLRNIVRAALIFNEGETLSLDGSPLPTNEIQQTAESPTNTLQLQVLERQAILEALRRTERNQVKAARLLGITDRTLREKLRRYRQADELQTVGENR